MAEIIRSLDAEELPGRAGNLQFKSARAQPLASEENGAGGGGIRVRGRLILLGRERQLGEPERDQDQSGQNARLLKHRWVQDDLEPIR